MNSFKFSRVQPINFIQSGMIFLKVSYEPYYSEFKKKVVFVMYFKSTIVKDSDLVIEKPAQFRAIFNQDNEPEIIINGLGTSVKATGIKEYFVNKNKTLITCSVQEKGQEYSFKQFIPYIMAFFYKPNHLEEFSGESFDICIESVSLKNVINNQKIKLKITEDCYEIVPMESEVIFHILVDNFQLSRALKY